VEQLIKGMKFYIKNMVCSRCKATVKSELDKLGIGFLELELGEVTVNERLTADQHRTLSASLKKSGFELISEQKNELIEKLKNAITMLEGCTDGELNLNYSDFISTNLNDSFISLNTLFSEIEGITIDKYIIRKKIDLIKDFLSDDNLNISEIAVRMHYNSVAQLSGQFKTMTGMTPIHFRQLQHVSSGNTAMN
jgi:AraC-like DNA-binding protein/copper chaperone CopZ